MSTETPFTPPLHHDRAKFADWGWIRDASGEIIYTVKLPICPNSPEADEHRRNKTDPTQARVDALLEAFAAKERFANRWTRAQPDGEGFYWWRGEFGAETILKIQKRTDYGNGKHSEFFVVEDSRGDTLTEAMGGMWQGPIPSPQPPDSAV